VQDPSLVEVTWSVSNIRRQFEKGRNSGVEGLIEDTSNDCGVNFTDNFSPSYLSTVRVNRPSLPSNSITTTTTSTRASISSYPAIITSNRLFHHQQAAYKDINGNPTTYI
jgi:NADH dehydrogenase/NADH:ubiquinone oxidoreductase subunit G